MKTLDVALFCSLALLATPVKEAIVGLLSSPFLISAFEGDGILIADTARSPYVNNWLWPNILTTRWTLQQRPIFGDAHHTVSFYLARKRRAHRYLYRFDSDFTSEYFYVDGDRQDVLQGHQHLAIRQNVYILPEEYTPGKRAGVNFLVEVNKRSPTALERNESLGYSVCQFQNKAVYSNFIDLEPTSIDNAYQCNCILQDSNDPNTRQAQDVLTSNYCTSKNTPIPYFAATTSSYNYFSAVVPTKSYVRYTANMTMYFYDKQKLMKHTKYLCTIRGEDTCTFTTSSRHNDPLLIIAYVHPKIGPAALTTTIAAEVDVILLENMAISLLYLLIPGTLIRICYLYYY